jgi:creatinine amidohydrolase
MFPEGFPGWDVEHASIIETSMMLAVHPELVRKDKIINGGSMRHPPYDMIPAPADTIPPSGVLYKARYGTREKGELLYKLAVGALVDAIRTEFGD